MSESILLSHSFCCQIKTSSPLNRESLQDIFPFSCIVVYVLLLLLVWYHSLQKGYQQRDKIKKIIWQKRTDY